MGMTDINFVNGAYKHYSQNFDLKKQWYWWKLFVVHATKNLLSNNDLMNVITACLLRKVTHWCLSGSTF
jgi:hypothetical protein